MNIRIRAVILSTEGIINVKDSKPYNIVSADYGEHVVRVDASGRGFEIYTFTFG